MVKKGLSLKEIQSQSFMVLKYLKEIFEKNNFKYFLAYGTLLGCVRHKGFIPWDDDIDIWMPREDYEKFIIYCKEHIQELKPFELIHYSTNDKYVYPIARFSDTRFTIEYNDIKDYGLGIFVDIYPLDGSDYNDKNHKKKMEQMKYIVTRCGYKNFVSANSWLKSFFKYIFYCVLNCFNLKKILFRYDKNAQKYNYIESDMVACTVWDFDKTDYKKEWFEKDNKICELEFNDEFFRVPVDYDKVLKQRYGDYMKLPEEKDRVPHHDYNAFKKNKGE